jgi:hypothetical protein
MAEAINQHKRMAMGENISQRGIHDMDHAEHQDNPIAGKRLGDGERSGPPGIMHDGAKLHATAHSDHGPHNIGRKHRPLPR